MERHVNDRTAQNIAAHLKGYDGLRDQLHKEGFNPPYEYYCEPWMERRAKKHHEGNA